MSGILSGMVRIGNNSLKEMAGPVRDLLRVEQVPSGEPVIGSNRVSNVKELVRKVGILSGAVRIVEK